MSINSRIFIIYYTLEVIQYCDRYTWIGKIILIHLNIEINESSPEINIHRNYKNREQGMGVKFRIRFICTYIVSYF